MESEIILSVCCITYNHENYIEDALKGFLNQEVDFKYEILIYDDASTDKTTDILKKYEKKYSTLIKVIYQSENQYSKGKYVGKYVFERAKGKYLAICEGDDYWIDKNKLQKQVDFLKKNLEYSAYYHNVLVVDKNKKEYKKYQHFNPLYKTHVLKNSDIETGEVPGQTASIVCKNFWKDLNKKEKEIYEKCKSNGDTKLGLFLISIGKIYFSEDIMSHYRLAFDTGSWNSEVKNKNICLQSANSLFEIKNMLKKVKNIEYEPNLKIILRNSFILMLKNPTLENIKIFILILKKCKNKKEASILIIQTLLKKVKIIKKIKVSKRPLLFD